MTPQQENIYHGLTGIDDTYLKEADACPRSQATTIFKRAAAVAAVIALILAGLIFFPIGQDTVLFSTTVQAAEMDAGIHVEVEIMDMNAPFNNHSRYHLDSQWRNYQLFSIFVQTNGLTDEQLKNTYAVIDFQDELYTVDSDTENLAIRFPVNDQDKVSTDWLCKIYGWTKDSLSFTVSIYHTFDGKDSTLYSRNFYVQQEESYIINGISAKPNIDPVLKLKSTNQLINEIMEDKDLPLPFIFSNPGQYESSLFRQYSDYLTVLYTRKNASRTMLNELKEIMASESYKESWLSNAAQTSALVAFISSDIFLSQLTASELEELYELVPSLKLES